MKIGIEMRLVSLGGAGGIAQLLRGVLRPMFVRHPRHEFVCFTTVFNRSLLGEVPGNVEFHTLPLGSYFDDVGRLCKEKDVDVLFRGYPLEQKVDYPQHRQVVEIPDIQHEYFPEFFDAECLRSRRAAFSLVLGGAGAIGTISEYARQTLLEQPTTHCRDIFLMSPALQVEHHHSAAEPLTAAEEALVPAGDYFLFPANLWKHKNHRRVLQAYQRFLSRGRKPPEIDRRVEFLFTGHPGGWEKYQQEFGALPIRHLGFVRPALLRRLLEGARALVFFSLYEGFGMPLLEAFDAGTPVICSNTTSLPEVGGDAVLSCDPTNIDAMSGLMDRILREPELRSELVRRGKERLRCYTWEEAADNLMAACERVAARAVKIGEPPPIPVHLIDWPRVALVTPSYNQGRFLKRTLDSVLSQNYPHIDYLVMDGGSTDESLDILRSYGGRLRWVSERDRGQTHAINKGFAQVDGEIHAYLNSDDVLLPGAVEKVVHYFLARPECDLVYGKAHLIDELDHVLGDYNTADYSFARLLEDCCISQPAAFWGKRIADRVGPFNEQLHFSMDYDYWMRIDRAGGRIEHFHEHLACTRMHDNTKTMSQRTRVFEETIRVCMKNAGYASLVYYQGFWHYLCYEKSRWKWVWKRVPCLPQIMGRLHHRWANRATYSNLDFLRDTGRALKQRLGNRLRPVIRFLKPLQQWLTGKGSSGAHVPGSAALPKAVAGYWGDNWVSETCTVRLQDSPAGEHLHLTGIAHQPMELTVLAKDKEIGVFPLRGQEMDEVRFHVEPGQDRELVLKFSKHFVDGAGRQLAFLLQGTNLFSEQDLAA
jgi:glycosyltransferase involved in cell wall biosynthesis